MTGIYGGHGALVHYHDPPLIIHGTRQGHALFQQQDELRARHGRRMR